METKQQTNYTGPITSIKLDSPVNFKDELKKFNIGYIICGIIVALTTVPGYGLAGFLLGAPLGFFVVFLASIFKVDGLRKKLFYLEKDMTAEEIGKLITLPLTQLNMSVEIINSTLRITHNGIEYDIFLYPESNSFRIWPQKSFIYRLFVGIPCIAIYKRAIFSMPIIAYTIQQEIHNSITNEDCSDYKEKIAYAINNPKIITHAKHGNKDKIIIGVTIALLALFFLMPSHGDECISCVKDGTFKSYQLENVGDAFDNFFSNEKWEYFESTDKKDIVEFKGTYTVNGYKNNVRLQFQVNSDNGKFEVKYYELNGEAQSLLDLSILLSKIYNG